MEINDSSTVGTSADVPKSEPGAKVTNGAGVDAAPIATVSQPIHDTRLNAAMRALVAIIAGLIVGDLLKATVATIVTGASTPSEAWANALIFLAATVFVLRVLMDNVLYYKTLTT